MHTPRDKYRGGSYRDRGNRIACEHGQPASKIEESMRGIGYKYGAGGRAGREEGGGPKTEGRWSCVRRRRSGYGNTVYSVYLLLGGFVLNSNDGSTLLENTGSATLAGSLGTTVNTTIAPNPSVY